MNCKHRWYEVEYGNEPRLDGMYMFCCSRCYQCRLAQLTEKKSPDLVSQG